MKLTDLLFHINRWKICLPKLNDYEMPVNFLKINPHKNRGYLDDEMYNTREQQEPEQRVEGE